MQLMKFFAWPRPPQWVVTTVLVTVALTLCGLRLWLVEAQELTYQGNGIHDDMLFVQLALNIQDTGWLGPYNNLTLAKGPFYPYFLAVNSFFGLPLLFTQNILYLLSVAALSFALRPFIKNDVLLLLLFGLLVFQPASFEVDANNRAIRSATAVFLALFTLAGLIRVFASRISQHEAVLIGPATGLVFAFFCLNREDSVWLLPAVLTILGGKWIVSYFSRQISRPLFTFTSGFVCFTLLPICAVMVMNARSYQVFAVTEFQHPAFIEAYGSLLRVRPTQRLQYIPLNASTRYLLYSLSPAFRSLAYPMEVLFAQSWAGNSVDLTGLPSEAKEIAGGWWMWALRDAASSAGYYKSGATAAGYYYQLAKEMNALCDSGNLICHPRHSSLSPILSKEDLVRVIPGYFQLFRSYFTVFLFSPYNNPSDGHAVSEFQYRIVTLEQLYHNQNNYLTDWKTATMKEKKLFVLSAVASGYQQGAFPFVILGLVSSAYLVYQKDIFSWVAAGISGSALTLHCIVTIIHFTAFPAFFNSYLNALYPFFLVASFVSILRAGPYFLRQLLLSTLYKAKPRITKKGFDDFFRIQLMSKD